MWSAARHMTFEEFVAAAKEALKQLRSGLRRRAASSGDAAT